MRSRRAWASAASALAGSSASSCFRAASASAARPAASSASARVRSCGKASGVPTAAPCMVVSAWRSAAACEIAGRKFVVQPQPETRGVLRASGRPRRGRPLVEDDVAIPRQQRIQLLEQRCRSSGIIQAQRGFRLGRQRELTQPTGTQRATQRGQSRARRRGAPKAEVDEGAVVLDVGFERRAVEARAIKRSGGFVEPTRADGSGSGAQRLHAGASARSADAPCPRVPARHPRCAKAGADGRSAPVARPHATSTTREATTCRSTSPAATQRRDPGRDQPHASPEGTMRAGDEGLGMRRGRERQGSGEFG